MGVAWNVLEHRYYIDSFYMRYRPPGARYVVDGGELVQPARARRGGQRRRDADARVRPVVGWFDRTVIDGFVNATGEAQSGRAMCCDLQSGNVKWYAVWCSARSGHRRPCSSNREGVEARVRELGEHHRPAGCLARAGDHRDAVQGRDPRARHHRHGAAFLLGGDRRRVRLRRRRPQYVLNVEWIPSIGVNYHVGIDGISMPLYVLTFLHRSSARSTRGGTCPTPAARRPSSG